MFSGTPRFFRSLRFRLALAYAVAFGFALALAFPLLAGIVRHAALRQADNLIASEAGRLLDLAARRKPQIIQADMARFAHHYGADAVFLRLLSPTAEVLASSAAEGWEVVAEEAPGRPIPEPPGRPRFHTRRLGDGRPVRTVRLADEQGRIVQVSRSLRDFDALFRAQTGALGLALAASLALGTLLAYLLSREAMARMARVHKVASEMAGGDMGRRVPLDGKTDEIRELSLAFNGMLDRIEAAIRELQAVTDNVAHDLRTPLTRMRAAAERALVSGRGESGTHDALSLVVEECDRLDRMTSTLLQIVRMDAGAYPRASAPADVRQIVSDAVGVFETSFDDRNVRLDAELPPDALVLEADRSLLERLLANLLDNALKFTPPGGRVRVSCRRAGSCVELAVADTGTGIAADDLPHVFDRFFRADRGRGTEGTGLGLGFVKAAARAHGGTVRAESSLGAGSRFVVSLPIMP